MSPQNTRLAAVVGGIAAIVPVAWLASSDFYSSNYAQAGYGYFFYNIARLWMGVVLLAAFWSTGIRMLRSSTPAGASWSWDVGRDIDAVFCGAAAWSIAVVILAGAHLYYFWAILPFVAVAIVFATSDALQRRVVSVESSAEPDAWRPAKLLLRIIAIFTAVAILLTIALWGNSRGDDDILGHYAPYYESLLKSHSIAPNAWYQHFFVTKGNGLALLPNVLSDVQGASLLSFFMMLAGGAAIWRFSDRGGGVGPPFGLIGLCLYLLFYVDQGAFGKSHVVRNSFMIYLLLDFVRYVFDSQQSARRYVTARLVVLAALILTSTTALALLLPILLLEAVVLAWLRNYTDLVRTMAFAAWAIACAVAVWTYNYLQVGSPEAPYVFKGHFVDGARFREWVDPALAYMQAGRVPNTGQAPSSMQLFGELFGPTTSFQAFGAELRQVVIESFSRSTTIVLASGVGLALATFALSRLASPGASQSSDRKLLIASLLYLLAAIALLLGFRMMGGGTSGGSTARFTDFINPIAISLSVVLLSYAWVTCLSNRVRKPLAVVVVAVAAVSILVNLPRIGELPGRNSVGFLFGARPVRGDGRRDLGHRCRSPLGRTHPI